MNAPRLHLVTLVLLLGATGCLQPSPHRGPPSLPPQGAPAALPRCQQVRETGARRACRKAWTLLVYMEADNDLFPFAHLDLYEMEAAAPGVSTASDHDTDVLVQLDVPGTERRRLHMEQAGPPYDPTLTRADFARRAPSDLRSPVLARLPRQQGRSDPAADLKAFLTWGVQEYPAEHFLVAVWGHGAGWGGIGFDRSRRSFLGIPTLHGVLRQVIDESLSGRPFDIYLSDACLMQSIEVTTELSDAARFIAGSVQVEDYLGLSYRDLLRHLNAPLPTSPRCAGQPDAEACTVAHLLPAVYREALGNGLRASLSPRAGSTFTLSAVRSSALSARLLPSLAALGRALCDYLDEDRLHAGRIRFLLADDDTPSFLGNDRDLGLFLDRLASMLEKTKQRPRRPGPATARLLDAIVQVRLALQETEVGLAYGSSYRGPFAAYSAWLPLNADDYQQHRNSYAPSRFFQYGRTGGAGFGPWQTWLERLF